MTVVMQFFIFVQTVNPVKLNNDIRILHNITIRPHLLLNDIMVFISF